MGLRGELSKKCGLSHPEMSILGKDRLRYLVRAQILLERLAHFRSQRHMHNVAAIRYLRGLNRFIVFKVRQMVPLMSHNNVINMRSNLSADDDLDQDVEAKPAKL